MRIPCQPLKPVNLAVNCLFFNDGSQKTLAAFIAWVSLCIASELPGTDMADFTHPSVLSLVGSLLRMDTVLKASVSQGDEIDSAISRIVKQNVDSKVQPVSALTWASVLASLGDGISLDQAVSRYNAHPEVQAFEMSGTGTGTGGITLDGRKRQVDGWLRFLLWGIVL